MSDPLQWTRREALSALLCATASAGLLPSMAIAQAPPVAFERPVIGLLVPLSGKLSDVGDQLVEVATLAATDARVELAIIDSAADPAKAAAAVRALGANPRLIGIIGPIGKRTCRAAAAAATRAQVPLLMLSSVEQTERLSPWAFRLRPSPAEFAQMMAIEARARLSIETAAILFPKNEYGEQAARSFTQTFTARGGSVRGAVGYATDIKDYRKPLDELIGKKLWVGRGVKVDGRRAGREGYVSLARGRVAKGGVDFQALFIPDFHTRVAKILPLLPTANMQSGAGGKGVAVQLLGMPGWHGQRMTLTGAHAAGALYHDPYGGENTGGRAEEFALLFESSTGRRAVDLEAEVFDALTLLARTSLRYWRATTPRDLGAIRESIVRALPAPAKPWRGVCGGWAFSKFGAPVRTPSLYRFDVDGQVMLVD